MKITVETKVSAPIERVWKAYTTPEDIVQWNAASDDWHTTTASVDLRVGGAFAGTYTNIVPNQLLEYSLGDRMVTVEFIKISGDVNVRVFFDAEATHSIEQQQGGWQAILDNFARHVEGPKSSAGR